MNNPGPSSYFGGAYRGYGMYQWNIKYYGWESDFQINEAVLWAFGVYYYSKGQFDYLNEVVGRPVRAFQAGRSGGWLVIDEPLTDKELRAVNRHIKVCMRNLPKFLKSLK
jgi:hypothetical protein